MTRHRAIMSILAVVAAAGMAAAQEKDTKTGDDEGKALEIVLKRSADGTLSTAAELRDLAARHVTGELDVSGLASLEAGQQRLWTTARLPDKRIDLALKGATVREAVKTICDAGKLEYKIEDNVPADKRIDASARGVSLSTALDLVADLAEVGWSRETSDGKTVVRVGKNLRSVLSMSFTAPRALALDKELMNKALRINVPNGDNSIAYSFVSTQRRVSFTCPHCKGKVTAMREPAPPAKCPKCGEIIQGNWQFCPKDGTKRVAATSDWHFCPLCGKAVDLEKLTKS